MKILFHVEILFFSRFSPRDIITTETVNFTNQDGAQESFDAW